MSVDRAGEICSGKRRMEVGQIERGLGRVWIELERFAQDRDKWNKI
jgi:hypothetical protein